MSKIILLKKRDAIFIFFSGLILFMSGLRNQEIIGFESRFYLFALEMWRHGFTWFPTTYHEPYPDYPVTSTALIYFTAKLFGGLNKWVAVFPSAVAAACTLSGTYLIGATQERKWGWYGVGFLLLTVAFLTEARTISLDMYVTAVTTWIFYLAWSAKINTRTPAWFVISLLMIFSFAIRGPVGIVIPAGVLCVFYLMEKNWKSFFVGGFLSLFLLILCTGILLYAAWKTGSDQFMQQVIHMEVAGRMEVNRTPSSFFYFKESIGAYAVTYPLAILIVAGSLMQFFKKNASEQIRLMRLLAGWVLVVMVGLSIPADKKVRYILSIAPALSLICAYLFSGDKNKYLNWIRKIFDRPWRFFLAVMIFFIVNVFIVEKINLKMNQTRDFVRYVENLRVKNKARLGFYHEGRDGLAIKYLINMPNEDMPIFISDIKSIPNSPIFLITAKENFYVLPINIRKSLHDIAEGRIGRDDVVVFSK